MNLHDPPMILHEPPMTLQIPYIQLRANCDLGEGGEELRDVELASQLKQNWLLFC